METELIGEFKGKNTVYRVLSDGLMEVSAQGSGKLLGMDAFIISTSLGVMENGIFNGEVNSVINTMDGQALTMQAFAVGYPQGNGGVSRAASTQSSQSEKFMRLNKAILMSEFVTDMTDNWVGKIWEWK